MDPRTELLQKMGESDNPRRRISGGTRMRQLWNDAHPDGLPPKAAAALQAEQNSYGNYDRASGFGGPVGNYGRGQPASGAPPMTNYPGGPIWNMDTGQVIHEVRASGVDSSQFTDDQIAAAYEDAMRSGQDMNIDQFVASLFHDGP